MGFRDRSLTDPNQTISSCGTKPIDANPREANKSTITGEKNCLLHSGGLNKLRSSMEMLDGRVITGLNTLSLHLISKLHSALRSMNQTGIYIAESKDTPTLVKWHFICILLYTHNCFTAAYVVILI